MTAAPTYDAAAFLARLWAQDRALVGKGFPPMSQWWRSVFERFFLARASQRTLRSLVLRVGRRGGKSSTFCRLAVAWALYGVWHIPPGDVGVCAFISVSRDEANQRLRTIEAILNALGVKHRRTAEGVELDRAPIIFKVYVASISGVLGFTAISLFGDELSAWRDHDTGANPAREVLASAAPTMATQPWAFRVLSSAPRSTVDAHYELVERGDTADQQVAIAPTWEANPTITEADTHALEPDLRIWAREYAAIPQPSVLGAFDAEATERAFIPRAKTGTPAQRVMVIDASSGRKDSWTYAVAGWNVQPVSRFPYAYTEPVKPYVSVDLVGGFEGKFWQQISGDEIVKRLADIAHRRGVKRVHADQREALMMESAFRREKLTFVVHDWTSTSKPQAVEQVRRWFADGTIALPEHAKLRRELLAFEERVTASGAFTFGARGSGHDDYVALLITLAMAELQHELYQSPVMRRPYTGGMIIPGL